VSTPPSASFPGTVICIKKSTLAPDQKQESFILNIPARSCMENCKD